MNYTRLFVMMLSQCCTLDHRNADRRCEQFYAYFTNRTPRHGLCDNTQPNLCYYMLAA